MEGDLEWLSEPPSHWTEQPQSPKRASNSRQSCDILNDSCRNKLNPGLLLDKWLADQERMLSTQDRLDNVSAFETSNTSKPILKGKERIAEDDISGALALPPAKHNCHKASSSEPREDGVPSRPTPSAVAWKLQLFKAAVGIKKKREEYDMRRRRSLLAFMKQAMQEGSYHLPTKRWERFNQEHIQQTEPTGPADGCLNIRHEGASTSYKWHWGSDNPASASSQKRSSILVNNSTHNTAFGNCRHRKDSLVRRFVLLQRKELLASHRLRLLPTHLEVESLLGEGASGQVWRVKHRETGQVFALKVIKKGDFSPTSSSCARVYAERNVLIRSALSHRLVKLYAAFQDERHLYLLQELLPGPSLFTILQSRGPLPEAEARRYAAQLALAVHAVHKLGFIHRDIKPENAILDKNGNIKLIDMGLASRPSTPEPHCSSEALPLTNPSTAKGREGVPAATTKCRTSAAHEGNHRSLPDLCQKTKAIGKPEEKNQMAKTGACFCCRCPQHIGDVENEREASEGQPKWSDAFLESFASWRLRQLSEEEARSCVGTLHYMAPEVAIAHTATVDPRSASGLSQIVQEPHDNQNFVFAFHGRIYSKKADWWSFGAVLFECLFGHPPFGRFHLAAHAAQPAKLDEEEHIGIPFPGRVEAVSARCSNRMTSSEDRLSADHAIKGAAQADTKKAGPVPLSCGLVSNPELLICTIQNWRKYLRIPPPPFVVYEPHCINSTAEVPANRQQAKFTEVSREAVDLLQNLLCEELNRFGFAHIKRHPWFYAFDWEAELRTRKFSTVRKKSKAINTRSKSV